MGFYIKVEPDVKIYVEDINPDGEKTILFIHGWPASHKMFEYHFNQLPKMGYRCIGADCRGFGTNSDRPKMLREFGDIFFFQHESQPFSDWFLQIGLQAAGWSTAQSRSLG